ncbi:tetratricopeptide repeat protein [Sulfurovum sp.]|uniref:tetratricopeptide repeat protein n=1 Tax=Sulfurovum sp. TaxID=1969726 RepID=UPI003569ADD9
MSWNRIALTLFIAFSFSTVVGYAKEFMKISEDELIIRGILYDEYKAYENSYQVYKRLYDVTGAEIYLFKEATSALMSRTHILESITRLKTWDEKNPNRLEVRRLLIPLYLTIRQVKNATIEAEYLLEQSKEPMDLDLASNSFLYAGNFKRALELLSRVYETLPREELLLRMTEIMDEFTGERRKAIQLLETHRRMNIVSHDVYIKLLTLYQKEKNIDGILETYKALYIQDNDEQYLTKVIDAYVYKRDIDGAIAFLEKYPSRDDILYDLYKANRYFSKALLLVDKLYAKDKNSKWIAEKGVLLFENSEDKNDKKMIEDVISHFEKAIELGNDDSIYLNYYGYTLIDKEVNVKKGISVIENALIQQPDNMYYLDSLAWGYYKVRDCDKAYKLMKRVVDEEGLEEDEIIEHWDAIKQCK